MAQTVLKITHLMAMIYNPSLEKVSSYGLVPRLIYISLLAEYKKVILSLLQYVINVTTNYKQITNLSVGYDLKV